MTREEAKIEIELLDNYLSHTCQDYGECDHEAMMMAVEALEQEPMLDKIRAEVESLEEGITSYHNDRPWVFKDEVLKIIDKHRAESEE